MFVGARALALGYAGFRDALDAKLAKIYYAYGSYWKGFAKIKKLSVAAKVSEDTAKKWLIKQALWQISFPALTRISWSKFDVPTPIAVHQADRTTNCSGGAKFSIHPCQRGQRYKEAELLIVWSKIVGSLAIKVLYVKRV